MVLRPSPSPPSDPRAAKKSEKSQKFQNESKMSQNDPVLTLFWLVLDFMAARGLERLFSDFFVALGPKGPKGSVSRTQCRN